MCFKTATGSVLLATPISRVALYVVAGLQSPPRRHFREDGGTSRESGRESGKETARKETESKETASKDKAEKQDKSTE